MYLPWKVYICLSELFHYSQSGIALPVALSTTAQIFVWPAVECLVRKEKKNKRIWSLPCQPASSGKMRLSVWIMFSVVDSLLSQLQPSCLYPFSLQGPLSPPLSHFHSSTELRTYYIPALEVCPGASSHVLWERFNEGWYHISKA